MKNLFSATFWQVFVSVLLKDKESGSFIWLNKSNVSHPNFEAKDKSIFISGCSESEAIKLSKSGYAILRSSKEAWLDLHKNHFNKRSLRSVIKAGLKNGRTEEFFFNKINAEKFELLKTKTRHANRPQIKYFFESNFTNRHRLFVIKSDEGNWLGALLLSTNKDDVKTELILRDNSAPNGIMEALIYSTFSILKKEGYRNWTLGEVPFIIKTSNYFSKEFLLNFLGRRLSFAYNYKGLFFFKNKFNPEWKDLYICSYPSLGIKTMAKAAWSSNLLQLIIWETFASIN